MNAVAEDEVKSIIDKHTSEMPVNVGDLAEELGISVVSTDELPEGMSGSITKENGDYVIYVNEHHPPRRQLFTIAHEIGHFVNDRSILDEQDEIPNPSKKELKRKDSSSYTITDPEAKAREIKADNFAGQLLMPKEKFIDRWKEATTLSEVADYFQVSEMAVNVRAMSMGLGYFD